MTTAHSPEPEPVPTPTPTPTPTDRHAGAAGPDAAPAAQDSPDHAIYDEEAAVERIVAAGPRGAFAVAGLATAVVVAIYLAFFVFAYLPRGAVQ